MKNLKTSLGRRRAGRRRAGRRRAGFSLLEVMFAASFLALAILGAFQLGTLALWQQQQTRERSIARLAMLKTRESMGGVRFRRLSPSDTAGAPTSVWIMSGGYEVARNGNTGSATTSGTALTMPNMIGTGTSSNPDLNTPSPALPASGTASSATYVYVTGAANSHVPSTASTTVPFVYPAKVDGLERCLVVEFPVYPLVAPQGSAFNRRFPGRAIFYLDETAMNTKCNTAAFPFPATPGLTTLDCNGDGQGTVTDLRAKMIATAKSSDANGGPTMVLPIKMTIDWQSRGRVESLTSWHLLSYRGYD